MATTSMPMWRDPKKNSMGPLFDFNIWSMVRMLGWPARGTLQLSRTDAGFDNSDYVLLDVGGEGYHESGEVVSGFNSAINLNAQSNDSQPPGASIPHLVLLQSWNLVTSYPFSDRFADYITLQGGPLTSVNVSQISRCVRPGGEIGLWIDKKTYREDMIKLASKVGSYVEWTAWDEFSEKAGYPKVRIPVPGADYMLGYSAGNKWFFIQPVDGNGKLGTAETDQGSWNFKHNALTTFKIRGKTYLFGWSDDQNYWFIQELLPGGKLGLETSTGKFSFDYQVMTSAEIGGSTYLIGRSSGHTYLFVQELLEGGKLGAEVYTETNFLFDQVVPFTRDGKTYLFLFQKSSKKWQIREIDRNGLTTTDSGNWNNSYNHVVVNVEGEPILFGQNQSTSYWFLQPILSGGRMGSETDNGYWKYPYNTLSTYTHGNQAYIFGQNTAGTRNWFLQNVLPGGKMGVETDRGDWKFDYNAVVFYTQYN